MAAAAAAHGNVKGLVTHAAVDGTGMHVVIVKTRWNEAVIAALVAGAQEKIAACGGTSEVVEVPGSYEVVYAARRVIASKRKAGAPLDAVVCIGCLIKGETMHFEYICEATSSGIMRVG